MNVAALCLGTMQVGWTSDEATAFDVMDAYVAAGGNVIDTADVYSRWAAGFLSGKYRPGQDLPSSAHASGIAKRYMNERGFALLARVDEAARAHDATVTQVALAWLLARPGVTAPIIGANSVAQLRETLAAVDLTLLPEDISALDTASAWRTRP